MTTAFPGLAISMLLKDCVSNTRRLVLSLVMGPPEGSCLVLSLRVSRLLMASRSLALVGSFEQDVTPA